MFCRIETSGRCWVDLGTSRGRVGIDPASGVDVGGRSEADSRPRSRIHPDPRPIRDRPEADMGAILELSGSVIEPAPGRCQVDAGLIRARSGAEP